MAERIVFLGGGGHCKSVIDAAKKTRQFSEIVITDGSIEARGQLVLGCKIVGTDDEWLPILHEEGIKSAFITVGSIKRTTIRQALEHKASKYKFSFPVISDPSAVVSESATIAEGVFVGKNAVVNADVHIGKHAIINTASLVEHECNIGDFTHVAVGAVICGGVTVGCRSFIGANATIIQGVNIGDSVVIGAGSVVLKDVLDGQTVIGVWK